MYVEYLFYLATLENIWVTLEMRTLSNHQGIEQVRSKDPFIIKASKQENTNMYIQSTSCLDKGTSDCKLYPNIFNCLIHTGEE